MVVTAVTVALACAAARAQQALPAPVAGQSSVPASALPDAPSPQLPADSPPCVLLALLPAPPDPFAAPQNSFPPAAPAATRPAARRDLSASGRISTFMAASPVCGTEQCTAAQAAMSCTPGTNPFLETLHAQMHPPLTARDKARVAVRGVLDPFNLLTIAGTSAISIASNADSAYGPGVMGWGRLTGITLTEDVTGEFFGTFLIPSIAHQDPHYHRMPNAPLKRRIAHCIYQVVWSQGDDGRGIFNYSTVVGTAASESINNLYVPYRQRNLPASAERYWTALATDPIGNFITEFVPDLAQRLNVRIVLLQRIVNRVAIEEGGG
jgi:hypothetical protein